MNTEEAVRKQIAEEIGDAELTKDQKNMLLQKYGVIAPQLTVSEHNLVAKEER